MDADVPKNAENGEWFWIIKVFLQLKFRYYYLQFNVLTLTKYLTLDGYLK